MKVQALLQSVATSGAVTRVREWRHRFAYKKTSHRMAEAVDRFRASRTRKPSRQIRREKKLCKRFWSCSPLHYVRYNLYEQDRRLSDDELLSYIPEFFFYRLFLPFHDGPEYSILLTEKNITEQLFRSVGIAQPQTLFKLVENRMYDEELNEISFADVQGHWHELKYAKLFIKPVDGQGGYGIVICHRDANGQYVTPDDQVVDEQYIHQLGRDRDYIVQPGLEQAPEMSRMYADSVNTFRIATERKGTNTRILCATLRMGQGGNEVDNSAQDGVVMGVDVRTGASLGHAATEAGEQFTEHPDTGASFRECRFEAWDMIERFVLQSAAKLPQFTYLGWDIALTTAGPVAIETNLGFGLDHYQVALGGLRDIFEIDHPDYYWRNKGRRA